MPIRRLPSPSPWAPSIGFSGATVAGGRVTTAGMTALAPDGRVVGGDNAYEQARETLRQVIAVLAQAGAGPDDVVQTRMYLVTSDDAEAVGRAHCEVFGEARPAATMIVVAALLDPRMRVEIEATAYIGDDERGGRPR